MPVLPADARGVAVLAVLASRLLRSSDGIDPALFAAEYAFVQAELSAQFPCVGDPATLTGTDAIFFDRTAALLLAARLSGPLSAAAAGGIVLSMKTADGTAETYAPLPAGQGEEWAKEAMSAVGRISCIQKSYAASSISVFGMVSGSEQRAACARPSSFFGFGLSLLDFALYPLALDGYAGDYYVQIGA